ncbi:siderophore-interacting protein [Marinomonas sp. A79]|uniref:Siderophore-interacting protein n=1 Tax=Marinomonas vulgaris TaxID=2823372 RepID=A0ABS5HBQ5_9GAMM|nr:siderophore-interacting protein [Marinomonas vulgaris]MBR7888479.1 siderophore-interacting protein [Marinomonas vulgaris]
MSKPQPRELTVIQKTLITPHMLRITLGGDNINTIPDNQESGHIKLIFPQEGQRPLMRTYTIRQQRADEIDVDFVLHDEPGPASSWAQTAEVNDSILIGGPGPTKRIAKADWYLLIGDMTALPAISVNLAELPDNAIGYAVIEVISKDDIQPLPHPDGIEIIWVITPHPGENPANLLDQVTALKWYLGEASVWIACEFSSMKALRQYFRHDKPIARGLLYISSYWKLGNNEDQHKVHKRMDAESAD